MIKNIIINIKKNKRWLIIIACMISYILNDHILSVINQILSFIDRNPDLSIITLVITCICIYIWWLNDIVNSIIKFVIKNKNWFRCISIVILIVCLIMIFVYEYQNVSYIHYITCILISVGILDLATDKKHRKLCGLISIVILCLIIIGFIIYLMSWETRFIICGIGIIIFTYLMKKEDD